MDPAAVAGWSLDRKVAEVIVLPVLGADPASVSLARSSGVGGILLIGALPDGARISSSLAPIVSDGALRPFVMVDQEGGGVQRLGQAVTSLPWPRVMAETMTTAAVTQAAASLGRQMVALHVDVDLAPVLDLDSGVALTTSDPDGPRSFSADPEVASEYGLSFAAGLREGGVLSVAKHFPGIGGSTANTDYGPASTRPLAQLEAADLEPFARAISAGIPAVMVSNASVPGLTGEPSSLSSSVVGGLLRGRLGFRGLVLTDSLSAGAVSAAGYTTAGAVVAALEAGDDMVLFGSTLTPADTAALAVGPLSSQLTQIEAAVRSAVESGALPISRLNQAVQDVVAAKAERCISG